LKIPIDDTDKYLISSHFETVFLFIENALRKTDNLKIDENGKFDFSDINYGQVEVQNIIKQFANSHEIDFEKTDNDLITGIDIDKISDLQLKNKLCQLLIKYHFSTVENNANRVLIHCSMGVSRSPALAIMYLMKKMNLSFNTVRKF